MITDFLESGSSPHTVPFGGRHDRFISPVALLISWTGYMRWKESSFSGLGLTHSLKSAESGYRYCILIITLQGLTRHMYPSLPFLLSKITFLFTTLLFPLCSLSPTSPVLVEYWGRNLTKVKIQMKNKEMEVVNIGNTLWKFGYSGEQISGFKRPFFNMGDLREYLCAYGNC